MRTSLKNERWTFAQAATYPCDQIQVAVLQDIRDELQALNRLLRCSNFIAIPSVLREISRNTTRRPKRKRKAGVKP